MGAQNMTPANLTPEAAATIQDMIDDLLGWPDTAESCTVYDAQDESWTIMLEENIVVKLWHPTTDGPDLFTCEDRGERHAATSLDGVLTLVFAKDYAFAEEELARDFDAETARATLAGK